MMYGQLNRKIFRINRVPLVVFGVDGYGWEIFRKYGNVSKHHHAIPVKPVFPSYSFPNLYSIVTGLYPTQHRIINARFYNQNKKQTFLSQNDQDENFIWFGGEPIWITATKAGLRTYTDMWTGSAAHYNGIRPTFWTSFNKSRTVNHTINDMIRNFQSNERCDLYVLYSPHPDEEMHFNNISSVRILSDIIRKTERDITQLQERLDETRDDYNLVIVSDHGMSYLKSHLIAEEVLSEIPKRYKGSKLFGMTSGFLYLPFTTDPMEASDDLNNYFTEIGIQGLKAVSSSNLDKTYQFCGLEKEGRPEVMILAREQAVINTYGGRVYSGHGYDNSYRNMLGQLRLHGPYFAESATISETVNITEIYNLLCRLLDISPAPNVGGVGTFDKVLKFPRNEEHWRDYKPLKVPCDGSGAEWLFFSPLLVIVMIVLSIIV